MQNNRTPHERRQHAMQVATIVTGLLFIAWLASLGARIGGAPVAEDGAANSAATLQAVQDENNSTLLGY